MSNYRMQAVAAAGVLALFATMCCSCGDNDSVCSADGAFHAVAHDLGGSCAPSFAAGIVDSYSRTVAAEDIDCGTSLEVGSIVTDDGLCIVTLEISRHVSQAAVDDVMTFVFVDNGHHSCPMRCEHRFLVEHRR